MKICLIADTDSIHVQNWVRYMTDKCDIHIISSSDHNISNAMVYPVLGKGMKSVIPNMLKIRKLVKRINPDVVHAHYLTTNGLYTCFCGKPFITSAWGSDIASSPYISKLYYLITKIALKKSSLIHVHSDLAKQQVIDLGCDPNKVYVSEWGFNKNIFKTKSTKHKGFKVCCIRKGAVVDHNVTILKNKTQSELWKCYQSFDAFLDTYYPKHNGGGMGIGLLEAMSTGLIPICHTRPLLDTPDFAGFLYNSEQELAYILLNLSNNPKLVESTKKKVLKYIKNFKSLEDQNNEWIKLYNEYKKS